MATAQWWRPTDTLYSFIMQCAGRADKERTLKRIYAWTQDCESGITAYSNDFCKGIYRIKVETDTREFPEPQNGLDRIVAEGIKKFGGSAIFFAVKKNDAAMSGDDSLRIKRKKIAPFAPPVTYAVESGGIVKKDIAIFRRLLTIFGARYTMNSDAINVEKYAVSGRSPAWIGAAWMFACNCGLAPRINSVNAFDTRRIYLAHNSYAAIEKRSMLEQLKEEDTSRIEQYLSRIARMPKGSLWEVKYQYAEPEKRKIHKAPEQAHANRIRIIDIEQEDVIGRVIKSPDEL